MAERLEFHSDPAPDSSGCRLWNGGVNRRGGYGHLLVGKRTVYAHRLAWELANGPIPTGRQVCHRCDRPACIEPAHLFLGSRADNMADMVAKGRQARGGKHGQAVLSDRQVLAILASDTRDEIEARRHGVTRETIFRIRARQRWAWLPFDPPPRRQLELDL